MSQSLQTSVQRHGCRQRFREARGMFNVDEKRGSPLDEAFTLASNETESVEVAVEVCTADSHENRVQMECSVCYGSTMGLNMHGRSLRQELEGDLV
jgi:hypothetical protein